MSNLIHDIDEPEELGQEIAERAMRRVKEKMHLEEEAAADAR